MQNRYSFATQSRIELFVTMVKETRLNYCVKEIFDMAEFLRLVFNYWVKRRILENISSKHEQLGSSLWNAAISSRCFNGDILELFQVLLFDRLYLHTLNNVCCRICLYYSFFFNFLFYSL